MNHRRVPRACRLSAAALLLVAGPARAEPDSTGGVEDGDDSTDWSLQLEAGSEYDSNIHRLELRDGDEVDLTAAPLARLGARHRLIWRRARGERLSLSTLGGLKLFASDSGQSENVAVISADAGYDWSLRGRGAVVGLSGSYYDAIPYELYEPTGDQFQGRHFRTAAGEGSAALVGEGGHRVVALFGYRAFQYKPDPAFDWRGEHLGLLYHGTFWRGDPDQDDDAASFDVSAGYNVERRGYEGNARTRSCADEGSADPDCLADARLARGDLNHALAAEVIYTGRRIYSGRYELSVNDSNSHGESLVRQRLRLGLTTELWRELYLTAEATVLVHIFLDPVLVASDEQARTFVSIDEENRNALSAHLSRPIGGGWAAEARYAIYSNEFTNEELTFRRQTVYLGAIYRYGD